MKEAIGNRGNKDTKRPCGRWFVKADLNVTHVPKQNGERKVFGQEEAIGNRGNKDTKRPCGR